MSSFERVNSLTYNGQPYRSQAEGLWARLMDQVGIRKVYEPTTVEFTDGRRYNPDFLLTSVGRYVEIKNYLGSTDINTRVGDYRLVNDLARCSGKHAVLIDGRPASAVAYVFDGRPPKEGWEDEQDPIGFFAYKSIHGGHNAVPILHELIQPSGYDTTIQIPSRFLHGSNIRIKNLSIAFNGEIQTGVEPAVQLAQNMLLATREPILMTEPAIALTAVYNAYPRLIATY